MKRGLAAAGIGAALGVIVFAPSTPARAPFWQPEEPPLVVRVMFGGDIMLDRNVARTAASEGPLTLFEGIATEFIDSDIRVANLEGTITANQSLAMQDNSILRFTFNQDIARQALEPLRLSVVSLANNHALDFGASGYNDTRAELDGLGIKYFGHPLNIAENISTAVQYKNKTFCFVGYHSLYDPATVAVVAEIQALRSSCWRIIAVAHWGVEYEYAADNAQRDAAHEFIDAGADLVVGAHPHMVQNAEIYKGKAIFYSLGNFMFDQNFSWGTTHGMLLRADFSEAGTHFTLIPTVIQGQKAGLATEADRQKVLDLAGVSVDGARVAEFSLP